jgi:hypothetical protein
MRNQVVQHRVGHFWDKVYAWAGVRDLVYSNDLIFLCISFFHEYVHRASSDVSYLCSVAMRRLA